MSLSHKLVNLSCKDFLLGYRQCQHYGAWSSAPEFENIQDPPSNVPNLHLPSDFGCADDFMEFARYSSLDRNLLSAASLHHVCHGLVTHSETLVMTERLRDLLLSSK